MDKAIEYAAVALGILNVILAARGNIWCWPIGIIGGALYVYLNLGWQLYYDMILQFFYVLAGFYGWWKWTRKEGEAELPIIQWKFKQQLPLLLSGIVLSVILGSITYYYLRTYITYFDATLTVFSFIATWMMAKKVIENWLWWIVIDSAGILLYWLKDAPATSFLFFVLTLGAAYAYYNWRKALNLQPQTTPT